MHCNHRLRHNRRHKEQDVAEQDVGKGGCLGGEGGGAGGPCRRNQR